MALADRSDEASRVVATRALRQTRVKRRDGIAVFGRAHRRSAHSGAASCSTGVRADPATADAPKHRTVQDPSKRLDDDKVRSREPGNVPDVNAPVQSVAGWSAHQRRADEAMHGRIEDL